MFDHAASRNQMGPKKPMGPKNLMVRSRRGSVTIMFAAMAIPLVIATGLAVDYSFYVQAETQLETAADAGALHAVRIAAANFVAGQTLAQSIAAGTAAGQQWFDAQLGNISDANIPETNITVQPVAYTASTGTFSDTVSYTGTVTTHVASHVTSIGTWPIHGSASASIAADSYSGFYFLIDNSSSMLIGATPTDIIKMEGLTLCSPTATATAAEQTMTAYSWTYPSTPAPPIGYFEYQVTAKPDVWDDQQIPLPSPTSQQVGSCYSNFTGPTAQCPYAPGLTQYSTASQSFTTTKILNANGFCPTGTGIADTGFDNSGTGGNIVKPRKDSLTGNVAMIPQAPCGFACHTGDGVHDYYTLVRNSGQDITLRFDVIQAAAANVMSTLISKQQITNQFSVGVYQFNNSVTQVHPQSGGTFVESDTNLTGAQSDIKSIQTPIVGDGANTNFPAAVAYLTSNLQPAGDGSSPTARSKNLFIITDGLEDDQNNGRYIGPITSLNPEPYCSKLKAMGFNIFVLYTPYYPLPNPFYLNSGPRGSVEPTVPPATTNPVIAALQACASSPTQYYSASDNDDVNTALQTAVQTALASPGRITN